MQRTRKPVSKLKMLLMWGIFLGFTIGWIAFLLWQRRDRPAVAEPPTDVVHTMVMVVLGGFFLAGGVAGYLVLLATNCFTMKFDRPVWSGVKDRLYLANVVVLTGAALGLGFGLTPWLSPLLTGFGLTGELAMFLPVMALVVALQIVRIFVLIWAPMERRLIARRLQARGITPAQLQGASLVGISNPLRSSFKKFSQVEEDVGALWVGPEQLIYWGDNDQFAVRREQLTQIERKADAGGTTMLVGVTHIILHVQQPDGSERQIRLHTEGHWTMSGKGRAMDALEERIVAWHGGVVDSAPA